MRDLVYALLLLCLALQTTAYCRSYNPKMQGITSVDPESGDIVWVPMGRTIRNAAKPQKPCLFWRGSMNFRF